MKFSDIKFGNGASGKSYKRAGIVEWEKDILTEIIEKIKEANEQLSKDSDEEKVIANEDDNEIIRKILNQYDIEDDEDSIAEKFGVDGLHMIRDAEGGFYSFPANPKIKKAKQKELAEYLGVIPSTVSQYEDKKKELMLIGLATLKKHNSKV